MNVVWQSRDSGLFVVTRALRVQKYVEKAVNNKDYVIGYCEVLVTNKIIRLLCSYNFLGTWSV